MSEYSTYFLNWRPPTIHHPDVRIPRTVFAATAAAAPHGGSSLKASWLPAGTFVIAVSRATLLPLLL